MPKYKKQGRILSGNSKYRSFKQIVNSLYSEEMQEIEKEKLQKKEEKKIKIEPKIIYDKYTNKLSIEFKIGEQKMYKLKSLTDFYDRMLNEENYKYGSKLEFIHTKEAFEEDYQKLLEFILKQAEIIRFANSDANSNYRYYGKVINDEYIVLNNSGIDEIFEILKEQEILFQKEYHESTIKLKDCNPDLHFILQKKGQNEYIITLNKNIDLLRDIEILRGKQYLYILCENSLFRCTQKYEQTTLKLLKLFKENFLTELVFGKEQLPEFFSVILSKVKDGIEFKGVDEKELEKYKPKKLVVKMFLDFDENDNLIADARFCYGEEEFNPLQQKINIKYPRDVIAENKAINIIQKTGFMYYAQKECFILPNENQIYNFLINDINLYMQKFEIMVTDNFKMKEIRQPKIGSLGVKVENNLLSINLENLNVDIKELQEIMEKYNLKKKYHKLKNGGFISLEENQDIEFLDKLVTGMDINLKTLEKGEIRLPINRSLYLNQLLKGISNTEIKKNQEYKNLVTGLDKESGNDEIVVPKSLEKTLRYYQKSGYKWLKTLDNYKFGGILADDMGLGKTIQMLSIIAGYV